MERTHTAYNNLITEFIPAIRNMLSTGRTFNKSFQSVVLPLAENYFSTLSALAFSAQVSTVDTDGETKRIGMMILQITRIFKEFVIQLQKLCKVFEQEFMTPIEKDLTNNAKKYTAMYKKFKMNSRYVRKPVEKLLSKKQRENKRLFGGGKSQKDAERLQIIGDCEQRLKEFDDYELTQAQLLERQAFRTILDRLLDVTTQTSIVVDGASDALGAVLPAPSVNCQSPNSMEGNSDHAVVERNVTVGGPGSGGKQQEQQRHSSRKNTDNNDRSNIASNSNRSSRSSSPGSSPSHHRQNYTKQGSKQQKTSPMQSSVNFKSASNIPTSVSLHNMQFPSTAQIQLNGGPVRTNSLCSYSTRNTVIQSADLPCFDSNDNIGNNGIEVAAATKRSRRVRTAVFTFDGQSQRSGMAVNNSHQQMSLDIGDRIVAMSRDVGNGWQFGRNLSTNQYGWFPTAFTVQDDDDTPIAAGPLPSPSDDLPPLSNSFVEKSLLNGANDYSSLPATPPLMSSPNSQFQNGAYESSSNGSEVGYSNNGVKLTVVSTPTGVICLHNNRRNSTKANKNDTFVSAPMPTIAPPPPPPLPPPPSIVRRTNDSNRYSVESNGTIVKKQSMAQMTKSSSANNKNRPPVDGGGLSMKDVFAELIAKTQGRLSNHCQQRGSSTSQSGSGDSDEARSISSTSSGQCSNIKPTNHGEFPEPPTEFYQE